MDKIHAMQLFIRVADLESFSQAAQTLGLPKGSVSRQIQALESALGTRLLHRTTRRVQLTQDGMVYYERCRDLLANLEELDGLFLHDPSSVSGRLRVDMPVGVARNLVMPKLPAFLQQYPGIELELSSTDRLVDVVREGFDCVLRVGHLKDSGLVARPLGKLTQVNCASPQYLERFGFPESLDDLSTHAVVHYSPHFGSRGLGFEYSMDKQTHWIKTGGILTVNSPETYQAAAVTGLGIIQVPRAAIKEALRSGALIEILPQYRPEPMPVSLLYPHRRNLSRRVHLFMEWLGGVMKGYVD
ncbi:MULTISPECIES: LysR family transcriptional regulator [Atlantibacter]|uniref:LysR family transcriptional regulator n=1 Tax=Atlantibacter TaxID=1903434 RepID=UPI0011CED189|nr:MULTISPECIES: LysR family transcriptional regulator [Atlantibacter]MCQ4967269.1 LysR family transcriptional regulator [Enterobacteriaceae bacterium DFI.7.85]MDQ7882336.1 LysR family transcriptional regulator [Atlantibacter hermannii]MDU1950210.1 LysR family transcriptional regulator [Atlantibacter hermannii]MDU7390108.1 LysR family transcriptional regulator [Atlantibacter hermannii]MDW4577061.1 LysR family transcriptional regulator [Atlantibacter hermannii]